MPTMFQRQTVWMIAVMLLLQPLSAKELIGCGCRASDDMVGLRSDTDCCCCSADPQRGDERSCGHCGMITPSPVVKKTKTKSSTTTRSDGMQQQITCPCGEVAPPVPVEPALPDSPNRSAEQSLSLSVELDSGLVCQWFRGSVLNLPPTISLEQLVHRYKQIVLCVLLT